MRDKLREGIFSVRQVTSAINLTQAATCIRSICIRGVLFCISTGVPVILIKISRGFFQTDQRNTLVQQFRPQTLPSVSFSIHYSVTAPSSDIVRISPFTENFVQ